MYLCAFAMAFSILSSAGDTVFGLAISVAVATLRVRASLRLEYLSTIASSENSTQSWVGGEGAG